MEIQDELAKVEFRNRLVEERTRLNLLRTTVMNNLNKDGIKLEEKTKVGPSKPVKPVKSSKINQKIYNINKTYTTNNSYSYYQPYPHGVPGKSDGIGDANHPIDE